MVNFSSAFNNLSSFSMNTTLVADSENLVPNMVSNANDVTMGYLGLGILTTFFLFLIYVNFKQDGDIRLDIIRSINISAGFTSILGILLLVPGMIESFQHVAWFILIFLFTMLSIYFLKRKGF